MEDKRTYVFAGNRSYVLEEMIRQGLNVSHIWVMEGSFLHRSLDGPLKDLEKGRKVQVVQNKKQLLELIRDTDFDILISNGCKYILPVSRLKQALYVNIHPSYLPDLMGKDPVNGACLLNRDCGAACHRMDDGIDTGSIIARVRIPMTEDLEAGLLFQLCFKAEILAFQAALSRNFEPLAEQPSRDGAVYYSMRPSEQLVDFGKGFDYVLRQARAFGYRSKGLYFQSGGRQFHFYRASELTNPFVMDCCGGLREMQVAFVFENSMAFKWEGRVMRFDQIDWAGNPLHEGDFLEMCREVPEQG